MKITANRSVQTIANARNSGELSNQCRRGQNGESGTNMQRFHSQFNNLQMAGLIQGCSLPSMESDDVNDKREQDEGFRLTQATEYDGNDDLS